MVRPTAGKMFVLPGAPSMFCGGVGTVFTLVLSDALLFALAGSKTSDDTATASVAVTGPGGATGDGDARASTEMQYVTDAPAARLLAVILSPALRVNVGVGQTPPDCTEYLADDALNLVASIVRSCRHWYCGVGP